MRRLQTTIAAVLLMLAVGCATTETESVVLPADTRSEESVNEAVAELSIRDTVSVENAENQPLTSENEAVVPPADGASEGASESPLSTDAELPAEEGRTIPIEHLLWLFVPTIAVAVLGYLCRRRASGNMTEEDKRRMRWMVGGVLLLFVVELLLTALLLLLGVLNDDSSSGSIVLVSLLMLLALLLNSYGAFATNAAILRKYEISFAWKRVFVYVGIALAVEALFAILMPSVFDAPILDARMIVPNMMIFAILLCVLFGVDIYNQNPQSLRAIPVVFILFMIGLLMSGVLALLALLAIGLWYVVRSCLVKEKTQARHDVSIDEEHGGEVETLAVTTEQTLSEEAALPEEPSKEQ